MSNAKIRELFNGWLWGWLGISAIIVALMFFMPSYKETLASIIMFAFMMMPVRNSGYRLSVWYLEYQCSIDEKLRSRLNPHATFNRLVNPTNRESNPGFYRSLWVIVFIASFLMGLLCMVFKGTSFNIVYAWLHSLEFLVRGFYSPLTVLLFVVWKILYYVVVVWSWGNILDDRLLDNVTHRFSIEQAWWRLLIMVGVYLLNVPLTAILLKFSISMTGSYFGFKIASAIFGIPSLYLIIWQSGKIMDRLFPLPQQNS